METKKQVHERISEVVKQAAFHFDSSDSLRVTLEEAIPGSIVEIARFEPDFVSGSMAYQLSGDKVPDDDGSPTFRIAQFESEDSDLVQ